ncbi:MAG: hypothetical protein HY746_08255, partial [Elusimicrobia bacterium]|nr:hypothetical protein [Elusimicrobiota bacterium]
MKKKVLISILILIFYAPFVYGEILCGLACCLDTSISQTNKDSFQNLPASAGGIYEGCGFTTVTAGPGDCGASAHMWSCKINSAPSGLFTGNATYHADCQATPPDCYKNATASTEFSIYIDAVPPQVSVNFPSQNSIVPVEENMIGEASDDMQLTSVKVNSGLVEEFLPSDGCTKYLNRSDLKKREWTIPLSKVAWGANPQTFTIRSYDCFYASPPLLYSFTVDSYSPIITIDEPSTYTNAWTDPDNPIIKGYASDDVGIDKMWLIIKDETADRCWNGSAWQAGSAIVSINAPSGTSSAWEYTGLTK